MEVFPFKKTETTLTRWDVSQAIFPGEAGGGRLVPLKTRRGDRVGRASLTLRSGFSCGVVKRCVAVSVLIESRHSA